MINDHLNLSNLPALEDDTERQALLLQALAASRTNNANTSPFIAPGPAAPQAPRRTFEDFYTEIEKRYPAFDYQPTQDEIARLTAMRGRPEASLPLALGAMLSRDKKLSNVGKSLYGAVEASRQPFEYGEGVIDPRTGTYTEDRFKALKRQQERDAAIVGLASAQQRAEANAASLAGARGLAAQQKLAPQKTTWLHRGTMQPVFTDINGNMAVNIGGNWKPVDHADLADGATTRSSISEASAFYAGAQKAQDLVRRVNENPEAWGLTEKLAGNLPDMLRSLVRSQRIKMGNLTPEQAQLQTILAKDAALLVNELYGAVVSAGEEKRATDFVPKAGDEFADLLTKVEGLLSIAEGKLGQYPTYVLDYVAKDLADNPYLPEASNTGSPSAAYEPTKEEIEARVLQNRGGTP